MHKGFASASNKYSTQIVLISEFFLFKSVKKKFLIIIGRVSGSRK